MRYITLLLCLAVGCAQPFGPSHHEYTTSTGIEVRANGAAPAQTDFDSAVSRSSKYAQGSLDGLMVVFTSDGWSVRKHCYEPEDKPLGYGGCYKPSSDSVLVEYRDSWEFVLIHELTHVRLDRYAQDPDANHLGNVWEEIMSKEF